ncbi:MAG: hypothetical protein NTY12_05285 [Candidatus Falkowbacteria bacterium]|nr:hypothetical protein [Candidatus Falkowbacteria bacterium]
MEKFILSFVFVLILLFPAVTVGAPSLAQRLSGKILLQVESHGEAWYVNPANLNRYYMADGNAAYNIMRNLGVGITNSNLVKLQNNKNLAKKQSGKIFLQVEDKGQAYYVNSDGTLYYLKDGDAAYNAMWSLGSGIKNNDLNKIIANEENIIIENPVVEEPKVITCDFGYVLSNNICITYDQSCSNSYGLYSIFGKKNADGSLVCYCKSGYEWAYPLTSNTNYCKEKVIYQNNYYPIFYNGGGVITYAPSGCDYFIVESSLGYSLFEWFGGALPNEGDALYGDFSGYGFKDFYTGSNRKIRVWVEDYLLSRSRAIEKYVDKCD